MSSKDSTTSDHPPITVQFLENTLKKHIQSFKTSAGTNVGDNFLSKMTALEVNLVDQSEPLYLLIKSFPNHPTRQKLLEDTNFFLKEYNIYKTWLPELKRLQTDLFGIKDDELLIPSMPQLVGGSVIDYTGNVENGKDLDPVLNNFLLMVDVRKTYGFTMANKLESLDHHHVKMVFEELAKYHALVHAYKTHYNLTSIQNKFPFYIDSYWRCPSQRQMLETLTYGHLQILTDVCKDFLDQCPDIAESFNKFKDSKLVMDYLTIFLEPTGMDEYEIEGWMRDIQMDEYLGAPLKEQWIVPGHSDCWTNNMLFKHDENGNVTDAILVDLQMARESCIMTDIVYFLYTSTDTDFRKQHLDDMLKWYFDRFVHFCGVLNVKPFPGFTLANFRRKLHRSKIIGLIFATVVLPITLQRAETAKNLDSVKIEKTEAGDDFAKMFSKLERDRDDEKLLRERYCNLLEELYEDGVI